MRKNKKGTRVERNSKINMRRLKKLGVKGIAKKLFKGFVKNTVYLIVGLVYATYLLIRAFNNLVAKLFMQSPRIIRVIIIYSLVLNLGLDAYSLIGPVKEFIESYKPKEMINEVSAAQITPQNTPTLENTAQIETKPQEEYSCTLEHETACKIQNKAVEYGIDWRVAVAISRWETGNFTSDIYKNKNNVGGLYCNGFLSYNTLDEGIDAFVSNLKRNYFDMGLDTLEKIQPKYCPIGAANDPNGLNKNWLNGVTKIYNSLGAK